MDTGQGKHTAADSPIADALDQNKQATKEIQRAADDLAVIHAVLDTKLAHDPQSDVTRAVAETGQVEKRLSDSAKTLEQVNQTLEQQVRASP